MQLFYLYCAVLLLFLFLLCCVLSAILEERNGNKPSSFIMFSSLVIFNVCNDCCAVLLFFNHQINGLTRTAHQMSVATKLQMPSHCFDTKFMNQFLTQTKPPSKIYSPFYACLYIVKTVAYMSKITVNQSVICYIQLHRKKKKSIYSLLHLF